MATRGGAKERNPFRDRWHRVAGGFVWVSRVSQRASMPAGYPANIFRNRLSATANSPRRAVRSRRREPASSLVLQRTCRATLSTTERTDLRFDSRDTNKFPAEHGGTGSPRSLFHSFTLQWTREMYFTRLFLEKMHVLHEKRARLRIDSVCLLEVWTNEKSAWGC